MLWSRLKMPTICGVGKCKLLSNKYGVCKKHKKFAYKLDDPDFISDINHYAILYQYYETEIHTLEINGFQYIRTHYDSSWTHNSIEGQGNLSPTIMSKIITLKEKMDVLENSMKNKYNNTLVDNAIKRISHSFVCCSCILCNTGNK